MYRKYKPARLEQKDDNGQPLVLRLLEAYQGQEDALMRKLVKQYGPEPEPEPAPEPAPAESAPAPPEPPPVELTAEEAAAQAAVVEFAAALRRIGWLPVHTQPSHALLPWGGVTPVVPLMAPEGVRPLDDQWMASFGSGLRGFATPGVGGATGADRAARGRHVRANDVCPF